MEITLEDKQKIKKLLKDIHRLSQTLNEEITLDDKQKIKELLIDIHKLSQALDKVQSLIESSFNQGIDQIKKLKKAIDAKYGTLFLIFKRYE